MRPLWIQFLSFACSFREKVGQIIGWHTHPGGWRPPVREILDPPLLTDGFTSYGFFTLYGNWSGAGMRNRTGAMGPNTLYRNVHIGP